MEVSMSGLSASETATSKPGKSVRDALADAEVNLRLRAIIRAGLGRTSQGAGQQRESVVEEVFSDVCSRALVKSDDYDVNHGTVLNWLGGFAWKILRERRKPQHASLSTSDLEEPDRSRPVPDAVADRMDIERLMTLLPPDERQLLRWDYEGWTASEIGLELNLSGATVRVRLHRLRKKAEELLGGEPTGGTDHE
jgi:RNA polymerase sigma factor (sigma-70 family)